jgi:hypothetical protein
VFKRITDISKCFLEIFLHERLYVCTAVILFDSIPAYTGAGRKRLQKYSNILMFLCGTWVTQVSPSEKTLFSKAPLVA